MQRRFQRFAVMVHGCDVSATPPRRDLVEIFQIITTSLLRLVADCKIMFSEGI